MNKLLLVLVNLRRIVINIFARIMIILSKGIHFGFCVLHIKLPKHRRAISQLVSY